MVLRIGTDCSGLGAPIQALRNLQIPHEHVFCSETDESIGTNYSPCCMYRDIRFRDNTILPDIDLYVASFPCHPFPTDGTRGNIFWKCLNVIKVKQPRVFILENSKAILNGKTWKIIWASLCGLEKYGYVVKYRMLNTRNFGIPQNRERVYIVGYKSDEGIDFKWPPGVEMEDVKKYVDWENTTRDNVTKRQKSILKLLPENSIFININYTQNFFLNINPYSPTITKQLWCVPMERYASPKELLWLQGFPGDFIQVVSTTQFIQQIINSMSVNVLCSILRELLVSNNNNKL